MLRICILTFFITAWFNIFAGSVKVTDGVYADKNLENEVNRQMQEIADEIDTDPMVKLTGNQNDFVIGNANANASNVLNGTLYSGLDSGIASVSFGVGGSIVNPVKIDKFSDNIGEGKDTYVGSAFSGFSTNVIVNGDNLDFVPVKNLMFEGKIGYYSIDNLAGSDIGYNSILVGLGARYKVAALPVQTPLLQLRALTVGGGLYFSQTDITFQSEPIHEKSGTDIVDGNEVYTESDTVLDFKLSNTAVIIPVEVVTSAKTLYFMNFIAGTGVDLVMGQSTLTVDSDSDIIVYRDGQEQDAEKDPDIDLTNSDTTDSPAILRYKMIFGFGLNFGPARVEMPIAYYPTNGYSISLVSGASF
ncbi:MAG: hypothetical protein ACOC2H_00330 [Spirochaetota bacterium]